MSAEDCNPNKSLRTTIKVFLRTAEKKREASRPKQPVATTPVEAPQPVADPDESSTSVAQPSQDTNGAAHEQDGGPPATDTSMPESLGQTEQVGSNLVLSLFAGRRLTFRKTGALNSGESTKRGEPGDPTTDALVKAGDDETHDANDDEDPTGNETEEVDGQAENDQEGYGSEAMMSGGMPNMMFSGSGDMNQMQMMMAMQNGMGPNSFGNFPMMGECFLA